MKEQFTDVIGAIDRIASRRPDNLRLIRLQAAVQSQSGDTPGALRRLRRAMRTTAWTKAELTEREELQLDARLLSLFLKQAAGGQDRATREAVAALKRCGYRSLDIACFVADTTSSVSDLEVLERAYAELNGPHEEVSPLLGIESTIEYLRFDFDASTEAAVERARLQPCSETAQMRASYMLSMSAGDYEQAARIGRVHHNSHRAVSACSARSADCPYFGDGDVECFVLGKVWVVRGARSEVSADGSSVGWVERPSGLSSDAQGRADGFPCSARFASRCDRVALEFVALVDGAHEHSQRVDGLRWQAIVS